MGDLSKAAQAVINAQNVLSAAEADESKASKVLQDAVTARKNVAKRKADAQANLDKAIAGMLDAV